MGLIIFFKKPVVSTLEFPSILAELPCERFVLLTCRTSYPWKTLLKTLQGETSDHQSLETGWVVGFWTVGTQALT